MEDICEVCWQRKYCVEIDVDWTLVNNVCEECLEELESENGININQIKE